MLNWLFAPLDDSTEENTQMEEFDFQDVLLKFASRCAEDLEMAVEPEEGETTNYEETDDRRSSEDSSLTGKSVFCIFKKIPDRYLAKFYKILKIR